MSNFPAFSGKKLIKVLKEFGFEVIREKGSHNFCSIQMVDAQQSLSILTRILE